MNPSDIRRLWIALLLLLSSLSSAPMASMEQVIPDAVGQLAQGLPFPTARAGIASERSSDVLSPGRTLDPDLRVILLASAASPVRRPPKCLPTTGPQLPRRAIGAPPLCERLPYQPNAPPA
jgi:hypothetical protein